MNSIEISLEELHRTRLDKILDKVTEEDIPLHPHLHSLKENYRPGYRRARKRIIGALWKMRKAKFKRSCNNFKDYFKDLNYV